MKTIEIPDATYEILASLAQENGAATVAAYIERLPAVQQRVQRKHEESIMALIDSDKFAFKDLNEKFAICLALIYRSNPDSFERLNGFTKPNGRAVFISKSEDIIRNSASSARPLKLGDSGFWVNVQGGQKDFEYLIDMICSSLGFSPTFKSTLIQKVVRAKFDISKLF